MATFLTTDSKPDLELGSEESELHGRKCEYVFDTEVLPCFECVVVWRRTAPRGSHIWILGPQWNCWKD